MGFNAFLDIAIGLVLMYLLLSLTGTVINEFISQILKWRARTLQASITQLLDNKTLRLDFYNHGLIAGLMGSKQDAASGNHPSYLSGDTFARALLGSLDVTNPLPIFTDVENAIKNLPDCNIRDTLLAHITTAERSLEKLRADLANWFDHAMDRLGGIYKRNLRWLALAVGLALAAALNADSIFVAQALWSDGALREGLAQAATDFVKQHPTGTSASAGTGSRTDTDTITPAFKQLQEAQRALRAFPIGWQAAGTDWYRHLEAWLVKIGGLIITGLAVSLGAPFWFDLLSKFVQVRATGDKPARSQSDTA